MPLQGDVYVVENNPSTYIIRLERRKGSNDHPGVGFRETELENLIARMESEAGHRDALQLELRCAVWVCCLSYPGSPGSSKSSWGG